MAQIEKLDSLMTKFRARAAIVGQDTNFSVAVGYSVKYALFVHENRNPKTLGQGIPRPSGLGFYWGPSAYGPGFLTGPFRKLRKVLINLVFDAVKGGAQFSQGLMIAGLRLQRESQKLIPVEYGIARASAFTRLDKGKGGK